MAGFVGWRVRLSLLWLSFPLCGNGLSKPLDSGLHRNDGMVDSGLRRAATDFLGGLFQTPLYHLGRLFQTLLYHGSVEFAKHPASMQACMQACP